MGYTMKAKPKVRKSYVEAKLEKGSLLITLYRLYSNKRAVVKTHLFTRAYLAKLAKIQLGEFESAKGMLKGEIHKFWTNSQRSEFNGWTRERDIHNAVVRTVKREDLAYYYGKYAQTFNDKRIAIVDSFNTPAEFVKAQTN